MTDHQKKSPADRFWSRLYAIQAQDDRAAFAKLRRAVAEPINGEVFAALGDSISEVPDRDLDTYLFIACLFAIHPVTGKWISLGSSMNRLRAKLKSGADSLDGRFAAILNSDREDLPTRLRHVIRLLASHEVAVHYPGLLTDMLRWEDERRLVQRRWARDYWGVGRDDEEPDDGGHTDAADAEAAVTVANR